MAKKVGLNIYSFSLWRTDGKPELHNVVGRMSFLQLVEMFAKENARKFSTDKTKEVVFTFDSVESVEAVNENGEKEFDILLGRVKTGEYGTESELVDVENGTVIERKESQADVLPFGFCIAVAKGTVDKGIIILQTLGNLGMKSVFQKKLQECMDSYESDYNVIWGQLVPRAYLFKIFEKGRLERIRLIRYEIPEDVSDRYGINYGVKQTREERIICRPVGFIERKKQEISEWMAGQRSCTNIVELEDFEYDDMKLEFKLGRTNKTISLADTSGLRVNEDITDAVTIKGGNPTYDSLRTVLRETAKEYLVGMGLLA